MRSQKQVGMAEARRKMGKKKSISAGEKANTCTVMIEAGKKGRGERKGGEIKTRRNPSFFNFFSSGTGPH